MLKTISIFLIFILITYQGCSAPTETTKVSSQSTPAGEYCSLPSGVSGAPQTIEDAVKLINSLPKPVSVSCFLSALSRPLKVSLTSNALSAQPAMGVRSPRIFIINGNLFMSVVPEGEGSHAIEFSYLTSADTSIKAELRFPVNDSVAPDRPYQSIRYQAGTSCRSCHINEQRVSSITFAEAFSSRAFQPKTDSLVSLSFLRNETISCNSNLEPERCVILNSLFGFGEVQSQAFPVGMPFAFTFF